MATLAPVRTIRSQNTVTYQWGPMTNADNDGQSIELGDYVDMCVTVTGTPGAATFTFEGSNDGTNWFTLNDVQGNAFSKTAAALDHIAEFPRFVRPKATGADGSTNLTCILFARRGR